MKKVSISILLILPIVLIFFISLLGRIISQLVRIPATSIEVTVLKEKIENNSTLTFDLDEYPANYPLSMEIEVLPTLANNKTYTISNVDDNIAYIAINSSGDPELFLHSVGTTSFEIKSKDNLSVEFAFTVKVKDTGLKEILVFDVNDKETEEGDNKYISSLDLAVGKTAKIGLDFRPTSTNPKYKDCSIYIENEAVASIKPTAATYTVTGLEEGQTNLIIYSNKNSEVFKVIPITVSTTSNADAYFDYFNAYDAFVLSENNFNFVPTSPATKSSGKIYINDSSLSYDDIVLQCVTNKDAIDLDKLENEKVLCFNKTSVVTINMYRQNGENMKYLDSITVYYNT